MDSKRLSLKAAVVTVPLSSYTYEIDIPLIFASERVSITIIEPDTLTECFIVVHGGFQASMIAHTVQQHFNTTLKDYDQPDSFNMDIMFLRPVTAGKAELEVNDSKLGPGVSTTHVTLSQGASRSICFVGLRSAPITNR